MGKERDGRETTNTHQGYQSQVPGLLLLAGKRSETVSGQRLCAVSVQTWT